MSRSGPEPIDLDDFLHSSAYETGTGVNVGSQSLGTEEDMEEEDLTQDNSPLGADELQKHSCVLCQQRKVKCNRTVSTSIHYTWRSATLRRNCCYDLQRIAARG